MCWLYDGYKHQSIYKPQIWYTCICIRIVFICMDCWIACNINPTIKISSKNLRAHNKNEEIHVHCSLSISGNDACKCFCCQLLYKVFTGRFSIGMYLYNMPASRSPGIVIWWTLALRPGPLFTKKMPCYQYRDSHYKPETVVRPS